LLVPDGMVGHVAVARRLIVRRAHRLPLVSGRGASPTFTFARNHFRTEEYICAAGVSHTFPRPSLYLDLVPSLCWSDGTILGPAGDGRVAWIARDDVADVATAVLVDETDGHEGRAYDVTGPDALTLSEAAAKLSAATGRRIICESQRYMALLSRCYVALPARTKTNSYQTAPQPVLI